MPNDLTPPTAADIEALRAPALRLLEASRQDDQAARAKAAGEVMAALGAWLSAPQLLWMLDAAETAAAKDVEIERTHADGCYAWGPAHHACAVGEIERLRQRAARAGADARALSVCVQALRAVVPALNATRMLMNDPEVRDYAGELVSQGQAALDAASRPATDAGAGEKP